MRHGGGAVLPELGRITSYNVCYTKLLRHPAIYDFSISQTEELVRRLMDHGLDGIEAIYSEHSANT